MGHLFPGVLGGIVLSGIVPSTRYQLSWMQCLCAPAITCWVARNVYVVHESFRLVVVAFVSLPCCNTN